MSRVKPPRWFFLGPVRLASGPCYRVHPDDRPIVAADVIIVVGTRLVNDKMSRLAIGGKYIALCANTYT